MKEEKVKTPLVLAQIASLLYKVNMKITQFFLPALLSFLASLCEFISVGLLLPLAKGIFAMDFSFARQITLVKFIAEKFPRTSIYPNSVIFALLVGTIFAAAVTKNILLYFANLNVTYRKRQFADNLRRRIFQRYLSFGKLFFDQHNTGYLHSVLASFPSIIGDVIGQLQRALELTCMLIVYLVVMSIISWKLTLLVIIIFPLLTYSLKWLIRKVGKSSYFYTESYCSLNEQIFNILSCIPLVKGYTKEKEEEKRFASISGNLKTAEYSLDKRRHLITPIQEIIALVMILLLVSVMSFMVMREKAVAISSFLIFFYLLRRVTTNFTFLNHTRASFAQQVGPISEVSKVFDDKDKFFVVEGKKVFKSLERKIEFKNLNFSYVKEVGVLKDITFSIEEGKLTAIVGPTGVGKTTLIDLLLRYYDCPPSSIFMDGIDIRNFTLSSLRGQLALVSQDTLLFNDTLKNNIIYGLDRDISDKELIEVVKKARLYDFIIKLPDKLDTYIGDRGVKLSGGEKQRVSIARALLKDAEILILDEATSSLDSRTERLIQEAIAEAIRGRTTVVVAHRLSTIKNADKIVIIEEGTVAEEGVLDKLLAQKGKFYQYWEEQKFY